MVTSWFLTKLSSKIYILDVVNMVKTLMAWGIFLEKYLFISDDTIELQMFQGCQNCAWCKCVCPGRRVTRDNKISIFLLLNYINIYAYIFNVLWGDLHDGWQSALMMTKRVVIEFWDRQMWRDLLRCHEPISPRVAHLSIRLDTSRCREENVVEQVTASTPVQYPTQSVRSCIQKLILNQLTHADSSISLPPL